MEQEGDLAFIISRESTEGGCGLHSRGGACQNPVHAANEIQQSLQKLTIGGNCHNFRLMTIHFVKNVHDLQMIS